MICHNIVPFMQPHPTRNPGGDCFACATVAAVNWMFPEKPILFDHAWESWQAEQTETDGSKRKYLRNAWRGERIMVCNLKTDHDYEMEYRYEYVPPQISTDYHTMWHAYSFGPNVSEGDFAYALEAWLSAGWVILTEISLAPVGKFDQNGAMNHTDHFILLDGQKHYWEYKDMILSDGKKSWSGGLKHETHVVCSVKGAYWIKTQDLMNKHGAGAWFLMRRDTRMEGFVDLRTPNLDT
jgi:hypothetical protein